MPLSDLKCVKGSSQYKLHTNVRFLLRWFWWLLCEGRKFYFLMWLCKIYTRHKSHSVKPYILEQTRKCCIRTVIVRLRVGWICWMWAYKVWLSGVFHTVGVRLVMRRQNSLDFWKENGVIVLELYIFRLINFPVNIYNLVCSLRLMT
jgi:hypothetical protein